MNTLSPESILTEARTWLNTPWRHNQSVKGMQGGVDCVRFVTEVYKACGVDVVGDIPNYYRKPKGDSLLTAIATLPNTKATKAMAAGNLLVFKIAGVPHHVGIATGADRFIHADQGIGKVVEATLSPRWKKRLIGIFEIIW